MARRRNVSLQKAAVYGCALVFGVCTVMGVAACSSSTETEGEATAYSAGSGSGTTETGIDYSEIYDEEYQAGVMEELQAAQAENDYAVDNMQIEYNPFGTNTTGLYVYFNTDESAKVSYTVSAPDAGYADFSATVAQDEEYQTEHEFQLLGMIPDASNDITITVEYEDGDTDTVSYTFDCGPKLGNEDVQLEETVEADDSVALGNGLYAMLGNDSAEQDFMYYYDTNGVLRAEIPIVSYRSHKLIFQDDLMYFSISHTQMCGMNALGQVVKIYDLGDYQLHHDYTFDNEGDLLVLATDTTDPDGDTEDHVIKVDLDTYEVTQLVDLEDLFGSYKEMTVRGSSDNDTDWDWMHINTIQYNEDGSVILSSRETSAIIKLNDLEGEPSIAWMISEESFWEGTEYVDYLLEQDGDFSNTGGQHAVYLEEDDSLEDGQYYLYMFNNNFGMSLTRPDYDWTQRDGIVTDVQDSDDTLEESSHSYYYKYLVDENAGTYSLAQSFEVPYSAYVSNAQQLGDYLVIDSGIRGVFGIYDNEGNLLQQFKSMIDDRYIYRVIYYDFEGFYFAADGEDEA